MACAAAILFVLVGWMLATYGLTLVVTHSSIMAPLRTLEPRRGEPFAFRLPPFALSSLVEVP